MKTEIHLKLIETSSTKCDDCFLKNVDDCASLGGCGTKKIWKEVEPETCKWTRNEDGIYITECGGAWELMEGDIRDNRVIGCPYCVRKIEEVE